MRTALGQHCGVWPPAKSSGNADGVRWGSDPREERCWDMTELGLV